MAPGGNRSLPIGERLAGTTLSTKILLVAALVFFVDSFLAWQKACVGSICGSASGWHGVGIIAVLCAIAILGLEGARLAGARLPVDRTVEALIVGGLGAATLLFTLIKVLVDDFRAYGMWIGLIAAAALAAGGLLRVKEATGSQGRLTDRDRGVARADAGPVAPVSYAEEPAVAAPVQYAPGPAPAAPAPAAPQPVGTYRLVVVRSPAIAVGSGVSLRSSLATIGRAPENSIPLGDDYEVSSRHAQIELLGEALWVTDLGSRNGTYVNGQGITERTPLRVGDVLRMGQTEMSLQLTS